MGRLKPPLQCPHNRATAQHKNKKKENSTSSRKITKFIKQQQQLEKSTAAKLNAVHMDPPGGRRRVCRAANVPTAESESSLSPVDADSSNEAGGVGGSSECRRSSRKKTIKFDVRDLLNKNRKSHKIQIEARIDSNAPKVGSGQATREELDSKQKNFIEKSAIFRRYSISENKLPPRPPPPPVSLIQTIQQCVGDLEQPPTDRDIASISPIARTQDILASSMIKPKQVSSLIVTKLESASTIRATPPNRGKAGPPKPPEVHSTFALASTQQKRRGRPPKFKAPGELLDNTTESSSDSFETSTTLRRGTSAKPSTSRGNPEKDESGSDCREISLSPTSSTKGIDLRGTLDASAVTLPQPTILDDCMLVSTDDIFVAAEEEVFTETLSSDESLRSSPKDKSNDEISLFARSNSTETNSSDDSETRRRKVRVSVKRVSLPSIIKESVDSNSKHSSDEKFDVIEIFSSNDEDSLRSREEEFPKSPKIQDDLCEESSKMMNTRASRKKLNLTPPAMATEGDNSNSTTLSSIVVISSASATPVDEMLMENAVSPTLRVTTNRRARSCKQSEAQTGESKNEGQIAEMAFAEVTTTIKPASPTYSQVALRKRRSAPDHAGQAAASRKVDVEETDSDQRSYPSPRVSVKSQLDAQPAEVTSPHKQTRTHLTSTGVFTVELTPSAAHLSAKNSKGPSPQFNLSASKLTPHEAASSNQKDGSFNFEAVGKVQSDILAQNTRSEFANRRSAALLSQKPDIVHQSQARDEPVDSEKGTQTFRTRSDLAQGRLEKPQTDRKNAAVALRYRKEVQQATVANGSGATVQPSPSEPKVSKKDEQAEGVDSKQNQRQGSSGAIESKIDLSQSSRRVAAFSSRNRSEPEQVADTTQPVEPPTKQEQVAALPRLSIPVDPLKNPKQPHEKVGTPKISLRSRKDPQEEANHSQSIESGDSLSRKSHQKTMPVESVPALAVHSQASTRSQRRSAEEAAPSQTTDESFQQSARPVQKEPQTHAVQSAPINSPAVTLSLQSSGDSSPRSTRSRYQKDTQTQAPAIITESPRVLPEATVENDNQQSARLRSRSLVPLKSMDREIHSDSAEETVSSQTSGKPVARSARSRSRKKVQSHQAASKSLNRQLESDSSEETGSSEKTVEAPARSSARSKSQKGTASQAVRESVETVSSPLIPSSEEESQPIPMSRVQKATQSRSARSLSRTRSLRRHAAEEQQNSSSESAVSEIGKQKSASPIYQEAGSNVNETTKEETPSTTTTSESTHRSSTDTSNSGRRESLRAAIRASTSPVKKMSTKRTSKTLPKAIANDLTSSSSESSEQQEHMPKGRRQVRSNVGSKSKEETSSFCSESSSTTSSSSTSSSSSASSSSSSSTSSMNTSSSSASEGRATRSRKALEIANGEKFESPLQSPPLTVRLPNEIVSDAIDKKLRKPEEDFTEPDSESSENSAKIRPKLSSQSSKAEKDCDALFKERAMVVQRRKSIRLNRWAAALEEETNETGSESSETSRPLRRTRSGRSRNRADATENAITVGNNTSENLAEDVPPAEISKENASRCVSNIVAQQSLEQPLADEGKTTGSDAARARSKSKGRRRRFVPINDSSSRSNTFSDDDTSSSGTSSNTRLLRNRSRRKTISSAKELYELLKPTPSTSQSLRHKSTENLREIDDKLPTPGRETQSKAVVQPETEIKSKPEVDTQKDKLVSDVQTTGETANKNETLSEDPARTPKQRKGHRFSLKNATEEVEPQEEISAKPEESPKTPRQRKKTASTSKSPKSFTTTENQTSITTSTLKEEALSEKVVSLAGESSPTTRSQRIAQKESKPSKVEANSSIHVSSSDFDSISTMGEISSNKVAPMPAEEISSKPTVGHDVQTQSVEPKPEANIEKVLRRPHGRSSSSRWNTSSEEDFQKTIESDSIPKVIEKLDANEEKSLAKLPVRSFGGCKQSNPIEEDVQKPVEHGRLFISPAEPEDSPDKITEGRSSTAHAPKLGYDSSPEGPTSSSDTIADSTQVTQNLEEANKTAMEVLEIPEPALETFANTTEAAKHVPFPETLSCVEKPHPKKEISPRKKNKTLTQAPDTPKSSEESQKSKNNKSSTETSTEDEKPVSSESNHSDDSQKTESPQVELKPHTPRRQLDSSFIESLEKSLLRPVSTKKPSKKKDKEPFIVTSPSAKVKEEPQKPKKLQETREEPKKPDTFSPKSKKKQKVEKKPDDDAPTKRKSVTKAKEQPIESVKSLEPDASSCEIPIAPVIGEPAAEAPPVPVSLPKVMKSKGETKFYPVEPVIEANVPPSVAEAPPTVAKEKSPDLLPDPLKDIEKFIEDGVNLLKRGYKLDDDDDTGLDRDILKSDDLVTPKKCKLDDNIEEKKGSSPEDDNSNSNSECSTLATTPTSEIDAPNGIRRSHRIKNSKSTKCLVGRGLVRDKERFSTKDDEKTVYSIDDQKMDLVEVEAKNSKFLKDMEERLSNFRVIRENEYKCERVISKEAKRMLCDCFLTAEEEERGELGCGEDCLNRLLMIECGSDCTVRYRCTNRRFTKFLYSPCRVFRTEKKGFGIMADIEILPGEFIMEYVGEVINGDEFEHRRNVYSQDKNKHYYFMALRSDAIIDATAKGNISRFINHSCDPNAETQKWTVNGELRIGFFSRKSIMPGEEITFDYQYQRYGKEAQKCFCESPNCRGWIGEEPSSEEEEEEEEGESEETEEDEAHEALQSPIVPMPAISTSIIVPDVGIVDQLVPLVPAHSDVSTIDKHMDGQLGVAVGSPVAIPSPIIPADVPPVGTPKDIQLKKKKERKRLLDRKEDKIKRREAKQFLEDPDIEDEVRFLVKCGLKNQADTLRLSRLIVRAKLLETRLKLLQILRNGELPCRRLFLDYHGLRLLHGWMSDVVDTRETDKSMEIRMVLLSVLECLPISNKTMLTDSKVYQTVRDWSNNKESHSPSDASPKEATVLSSSSPTVPEDSSCELQKLASKLVNTWDNLPEVFRIPKRERIEQMKEHEREADKGLGQNISKLSGQRNRERFMRNSGPNSGRFKWSRSEKDKERERAGERRRYAQNSNGSGKDDKSVPGESHLSKEQRRELFAAKVARDEAEKRLAEERREFDIKCRFFGLDPKRMRPENMPFCVNPSTGQWYSTDKKPISTPPSYAHVQVPVKPKSTNTEDYRLPPMDLPPLWKFAISPKGKIYYYHVKIRIPQWEPPIKILPLAGQTSAPVKNSESDSSNAEGVDSSEDDIDIIKGLDPVKLQAYIEKKIEDRRLQRYTRLVVEKPISPRKEEDRIYNQMEVRKYKENKEKIRKRKEDIRRRGEPSSKSEDVKPAETAEVDETPANALPIQDFLLSSDEDINIKAECNNSPLIEKIVQGDKIVDELDALHSKRALKRPLAIREKYEHKKRKPDKKESSKSTKRSKDGEGSSSSSKYRKIKEKFRCEIAGIIVHHLKPYRKETCLSGRVLNDDDFNHLARKLTHFVMVKEMKYCESIGQTLFVTESVKNKSREFIKKYMAKYGGVYVRPKTDPEYKEIPFL